MFMANKYTNTSHSVFPGTYKNYYELISNYNDSKPKIEGGTSGNVGMRLWRIQKGDIAEKTGQLREHAGTSFGFLFD